MFYVTERIKNESSFFVMNIIEGYETHKEAQAFVQKEIAAWRDKGYKVNETWLGDELWGATALDSDCFVKGSFDIFASPVFMAGFNRINQ